MTVAPEGRELSRVDGRTDGRTNTTQLTVALGNFEKAPTKWTINKSCVR